MNNLMITTGKMINGGKCIAKLNGKTVFVSNVLPEEEVSIRISEQKKDYDEAIPISILKPSPFRRQPICKNYMICGGCSLQIANDDYQKELRKNILYDSLIRSGIQETQLPQIQVISGSSWEYRNRFQFHNNNGLMKASGNEIIQIDECPIATKKIQEYLKDFSRQNKPENTRTQVFSSEKIITENKIIIAKENNKIQGTGKRKIYGGTLIDGQQEVQIDLLGKQLSFDVRGFFQSNIEMLEKTISLVIEGLSGNKVLDFYSGVGTFSIFLADLFKHVSLVEHNRDALVMAEKNLQNIPHESFGLSGENFVKQAKNFSYDAVVIDPPRSGMEKQVNKWLCESKIPVIRSLSCDPVTQSRDVKKLLDAGYQIEKIFLLDYYPQTSHIESLIHLRRYV